MKPAARNAVVAAVTGFALVVVAAFPAGAGLASVQTAGGLTYVSVSRLVHSDGQVSVKCPPGTHVYGGGAVTRGPSNHAWIAHTRPIDSGDPGDVPDDGWSANVHDFASGSHAVTITAICGGPRPKYRVLQTHVRAIGPSREVGCPPGTHVYSGGTRGPGTYAGASVPFDGPDGDSRPDDGWRVFATSNGIRDLDVFAVCGSVSPRYANVSTDVAAQHGSGDVDAVCPATKHVYGGGLEISDPQHAFALMHVTAPVGFGGSAADAWQVFVYNDQHAVRTLTVYAVCGKSLNG
jgi:hypothetical protein